MKKTGLKLILLLLFSVGLISTSHGAVRNWEIDGNHSNFYFSVDHIFSETRGQFTEFSGVVHFDPANLAESSMEFRIAVKSIDTHNAKRDKHLQSADFFDEGEYPELLFISKDITQVASNEYRVAGKFTVKGKEFDLVLPLTLTGVKNHPMKKDHEVAGFDGKLTLDRLKYGVGTGKFVELGVVGKMVDVFISLELLSKK